MYTLILNPDQTYEVKIDNEKVESGSLEDDWDFLPPKTIKDPEASKPEDWDDRAKIDDADDTKPEVNLHANIINNIIKYCAPLQWQWLLVWRLRFVHRKCRLGVFPLLFLCRFFTVVLFLRV